MQPQGYELTLLSEPADGDASCKAVMLQPCKVSVFVNKRIYLLSCQEAAKICHLGPFQGIDHFKEVPSSHVVKQSGPWTHVQS